MALVTCSDTSLNMSLPPPDGSCPESLTSRSVPHNKLTSRTQPSTSQPMRDHVDFEFFSIRLVPPDVLFVPCSSISSPTSLPADAPDYLAVRCNDVEKSK